MARKKKEEKPKQNKNPYAEYSDSVKAKLHIVSDRFKDIRNIAFARKDCFYAEKPFSSHEIDFLYEFYNLYSDDGRVRGSFSGTLSHTQNCRIDERLRHIRSIISQFDASYMEETQALYLIGSHLIIMLTELRFK